MFDDIQASPRAVNGSSRPRVAFVVQRAGVDIAGGAEQLCLQIALRMSQHWETEVLTTCAHDYMEWRNSYPPGPETVGNTIIRRFSVDQPRDVESFNRLSAALCERQANTTLEEQERWMREQGPVSTELLQYLEAHHDHYDAFIFFGYLYATTYFGLPLVQDKAVLAPLAHDEWPIHFSMWDRFFSRPRQFIFNTDAERDFVNQRFRRPDVPDRIAGVGIEPPSAIDAKGFKSRNGLSAPFLLYVGRIDESKGCRVMIDYFVRWKEQSDAPHKLVLLGAEVMPVPFHDDIISLGFVDETEKWAAMKACDWLIMPSPYESLSIVLLEGWSLGCPALVNGECDVLVRHCQQSNAGLWYKTYEEWSAALDLVDDRTRAQMGRQGPAYVRERYSWERVESDYLALLRPLTK